jgi:hypothetical protein
VLFPNVWYEFNVFLSETEFGGSFGILDGHEN